MGLFVLDFLLIRLLGSPRTTPSAADSDSCPGPFRGYAEGAFLFSSYSVCRSLSWAAFCLRRSSAAIVFRFRLGVLHTLPVHGGPCWVHVCHGTARSLSFRDNRRVSILTICFFHRLEAMLSLLHAANGHYLHFSLGNSFPFVRPRRRPLMSAATLGRELLFLAH